MKLFHSRHLAQKATLQRRTFLKALALGISAPLAMKMSKLAVAQTAGKPTRLFILFLPHGAPIEHYEVLEAGGVMDLGASGEGILSPLDPYKEWLTVLRGVGNKVSTNHAAITSVLTGGDGEGNDSIDHIIARELGLTAHVLGVQPHRGFGLDHDSKVFHHGSWVSPLDSPHDAIEELFAGLSVEGGTPPPAGEMPISDEAAFRNEALDLTIGEVEAMKNAVAGLTKEENKLQTHLDSLLALKSGGGGGAIVSCTGRPPLAADGMAGVNAFDNAQLGNILDAHLEMAAHSLICGSSRIVSLQAMYANAQLMMDFAGGPGISANHHDPLSHSFDSAGRANFARVQKWFYSRLAEKLVKLLAETDDPADPGSKVLDNTTILTCSEIADGANHNSDVGEIWLDGRAVQSYLPWVLIGKGGGLFAGNRIARFEGSTDHRNILAALAESMGVSLPTIAGQNVATPAEVKA